MTPNEANQKRKAIRTGLKSRFGWAIGARRREKLAEIAVNSHQKYAAHLSGEPLENAVRADVKQACESLLTMFLFAMLWEVIKRHLFS